MDLRALLLLAVFAPLANAAALTVWALARPDYRGPVPAWLSVGASALSLASVVAIWGREAAVGVTWLKTAGFAVPVGLATEPLAWFAALVVSSVSLVIILYSVGYTSGMAGRTRFFAQISFFTGSMLALVLADSLLLLFGAWEFVGVASFMLIGFHFRESAARRAALEAFVVTRLGDLGFLAAWLLLLGSTGTVVISSVLTEASTGGIPDSRLTLVALLLFAAAVGKSAQLPLTAWLPAAMAGPTPVSALIHSATMVAAGVFLVLRLFPIFEAAPGAREVILGIGVATALLAAIVATSQVDFKRVLAWSTVSQLGEMMMALGLGAPLAAAYHLTTHATFKGALFLTAGGVDHAAGTRDLRRLGGLWRRMPITAAAMTVSALALAGIPPFSGFWSEDHILSAAVRETWWFGAALLLLILLAGFYIGRAVTAILGRWPGAPRPEAGPPARSMEAAAAVLAAAAAVSGLFLTIWGTSLLPFEEEPSAGAAWRIGAALAGATGLALGWALVRSRGPATPLALVSLPLERSVDLAVAAPGRGVLVAATAVGRVESAFDAAAGRAAGTATVAAAMADKIENGFDAAAQYMSARAVAAADEVERAERSGFGGGGDTFARSLAWAGAEVRRAQTGRLYLYTLSLFVWVGIVGLVSLFWWR